MSRLGKWKLEKAKVKVVFRLQFHATHVPHAGWDKLFVSLIPADSIKASAKTTKALVRNGTCKWGDPIYETTRLLQDTRTKQYDEKLYKIVVAMGSSRASILGETMINLAEYADALKPFAVVLPLQGSDSGALLHVTVQLLTSKTGFKEFEQQRELLELRESGPSETPDHISPEESSPCRTSPSHETLSHVDEADSLYKDIDLSNAIEENIKLKGFIQDMESSFNEMKIEVSSLQRHADDIGSKAQEFSRILISEIGSGDQLVREVSMLKSECSKLKESLREDHNSIPPHNLQQRWLQGLLAVEDKIREIQNKVCYSHHDRDDLRSFLSDFESLLGVLLDLKRQIVSSDKKERGVSRAEQFASCSELDTDVYQPELDSVDSVNAMRDKIVELARGLDESRDERDSLAKRMDQMECYYESLVQELEETQRQLLVEMQNLTTEHSTTCFYRDQALRFSEEKKSLESLNEEAEKRVVAAEAALRRARLNYSIGVKQLQKDLEMLSSQVVSMYETNERVIKKGDVLLVQEGLHRKDEEELYEMHSRNLYLEVFSKILRESLVEAEARCCFGQGLDWNL